MEHHILLSFTLKCRCKVCWAQCNSSISTPEKRTHPWHWEFQYVVFPFYHLDSRNVKIQKGLLTTNWPYLLCDKCHLILHNLSCLNLKFSGNTYSLCSLIASSSDETWNIIHILTWKLPTGLTSRNSVIRRYNFRRDKTSSLVGKGRNSTRRY